MNTINTVPYQDHYTIHALTSWFFKEDISSSLLMTFLEFSALTRDSSDNACEDAIHCRLYHCNGIIPLSSLFVFVWAVPVMKWPLPQASYTVADGSPSPDRYRWTRASAMVAPTSVACDCSNCNNDELSSLSCCSDDILDSAVSSWWFKSCGREIIIKLLQCMCSIMVLIWYCVYCVHYSEQCSL